MNDVLLFIFFFFCWVGAIMTSLAVFAGIRSLVMPKPPEKKDWKFTYTETAPPARKGLHIRVG